MDEESTHKEYNLEVLMQLLTHTRSYELPSLSNPNPGVTSVDGSEVYFIGVIDILQKYNFNKKAERCLKVYVLQEDKASTTMDSYVDQSLSMDCQCNLWISIVLDSLQRPVISLNECCSITM